jgi:tape measure domain-containing protein
MAKGTELATAYVSILADTSNIDKDVRKALSGTAKYGDVAGRDMGARMSAAIGKAGTDSASKFSTGFTSQASKGGRSAAGEFVAGLKAGIAQGRVAEDAGKKFSSDVAPHMRRGGASAGAQFTAGLTSSLSRGLKGAVIGTLSSLGLAGGIGAVLFKGFERLEKLDQATTQLRQMGKTGEEIAQIMTDVQDVIKGTPVALQDAFGAVNIALSSGIKPGKDLKRYLKDIADAAGKSGQPFEDIALIFGQVQAKGRLMGEEVMQFMEHQIPIQAWLQDTFHLTAKELEDLQKNGSVSMDMLETAIEQHAGGMAAAMGQTIGGAIENTKTAIARLGADFLIALTGDPIKGSNTLADSINIISTKINGLDDWVKSHSGTIKEYFDKAITSIETIVEDLGKVAGFLTEHPGLIQAVVVAFGAWKAIEGVSALITSLKTISTLLSVTIPASASAAGGSMAAIAGPLGIAVAAAVALNQIGGVNVEDFDPRKSSWGHILFGPGYDKLFGGGGEGTTPSGPQSFLGSFDTSGRGGGRQAEHRGVPLIPQGGPAGHPGPPQIGGGGNALPGGGVQGTVYNGMLQAGFPASEWGALQNLLNGESGFRPTVRNSSSGAYGLFQFLGHENDKYGALGAYSADPASQTRAGMQYIKDRYGSPSAAYAFWLSQNPHWYTRGGGVDSVPAMLAPGEHVLTTSDVAALGGQSGVYAFRNALHRNGGGEIPPWILADLGHIYDPRSDPKNNPWITRGDPVGGQGGKPLPNKEPPWTYKKGFEYAKPGLGNSIWTISGEGGIEAGRAGSRPGFKAKPKKPKHDIFDPWWQNRSGVQGLGFVGGGSIEDWMLAYVGGSGLDPQGSRQKNGTPARPGQAGSGWSGGPFGPFNRGALPPDVAWDLSKTGKALFPKGRERYAPGNKRGIYKYGWWGFQEGGAVDPELLKQLQDMGVIPGPAQQDTVDALASLVPGTQGDLAQALAAPGMNAGDLSRTEGYIPAAAGSTGVAGTSFASSLLNLGSQAVQGIIDQAASAASAAASAAGNAFAPGSGGAASAGISLAAGLAKRGVAYGFQMAGIGTDALIEQLFPFGAPRWLGYDYTGFMPQLEAIPALTTSLEQAVAQQGQGQGTAPPMPPGTEHLPPGAQPGVPPLPGPPQTPPGDLPPGAPGALEPPGAGAGPGPGTPEFGSPPPSPTAPQGAAALGMPQGPPPSPVMPTQPGNLTDPNYLKNLFGFDRGGWMEPGTVGANYTKRPEAVFTDTQWSSIQKAAVLPPGEGNFGVRIENMYTNNPDETKRQIDKQQRLAAMRYGGRPY